MQVVQQWLSRCPGAVGATELAAAIGEVAAPAHPGDVDLSSGDAFSETRFGSSGGSCPAPTVLNIMGHSIQFDTFSKVCAFGAIFKVFAMLFAYLVAGRTVLGSLIAA